MSAKPSPNEERQPGQPFHYKPSALLEPEEGLIERMVQLGMLQVTHPEAAAVLGVSKNTLERFWAEHPTFREAFEAGKELDKVRLRRTLRMHAQLDAGTARFLAKNQLGLSDDPSKAKLDEQTAKTLKGMTRQEADGRILELKAKLIGTNVSQDVSHERAKVEEGQDDAEDVALHERRTASAAPQAEGRQVSIGAGEEGRKEPRKGEGSAVAKLEKRLAELEASTVRKNPRKDGAPHTDRTKAPMDAGANTRQEVKLGHAPSRLPGRLGSR